MRALIFAAGRGERMRPLTDHTPKPLLEVGGKPLIVWHLEKLAALGITDVVINTSHLAEMFPATLGNGSRWGLTLHYSYEGPEPLETGGGMLHALPLLGTEPFIAVNGDIWTDFDFAQLPCEPIGLAHLVMVDNPPQHPHGDFALAADGRLRADGEPRLTFAGVGIYRPALLETCSMTMRNEHPHRFRLAPLLRQAMGRSAVTGIHHRGHWHDVGTPGRLARLSDDVTRHSR
jgi:N-acetyl-alpha-D-muramate 1-phosphate uridylyltransferase